MPGVPPGQNRIRLVLPFPKIQRTRESDTRSQSYRCLKFFLTVELWKFITNCTKTQINWNLCQFCVLFNALHAGKFSWFLKLFWTAEGVLLSPNLNLWLTCQNTFKNHENLPACRALKNTQNWHKFQFIWVFLQLVMNFQSSTVRKNFKHP